MQEIEIRIPNGVIFDKTKLAWDAGNKIIIHRGGTGSAKTFDIMIFLIMLAITNTNWIITVVSESKPHLDIGAIRILKTVLMKAGLFKSDQFNISTSRYTFDNGTIIEFFSADRIDKALGARRNVLYGNEINSLKFEVWDELARRSEYIIGDFNPTQQFWLEKFIDFYGKVEVIRSNYSDNPFLPETERNRIIRRAEMDANFKRIHIDCEYGSYDGLVFTEFNIIDQMPEGLNTFYGMDWGYTNDPTAVVQCAIKDKDIYLNEKLYRTGLTNSDIARILIDLGIRPNYDEIFADSAEPKSIEDLRRAGFNIKPAMKGEDSIRKGIDKMKEYRINITQNSVNLIKEFRNYSWISDKTGQPTNKPIDAFNHGIDSSRYGIMTKLGRPTPIDFFA